MLLPSHITVSLRPGSGAGDALTTRKIFPRKDDGMYGPTIWIIIAVIAGTLAVAIIACFVAKRRRSRKGGRYHQTNDSDTLDGSSAGRNGRRRRGSLSGSGTTRTTNRNSVATNNTAQVDRNTSVRSIMTLPAYRNKPNDNEQVLGREGERDGVDVVVEYPTEEDHEALRDEEMETLYQIRLTRRQQQAEREERRRLTREARDRGDLLALDDLRARRRAESQSTVVSDLREEVDQIKERRHRAISSVSYHDLGVARHDGTRIRANSTESTERVGLLSDAASIAATSQRSPSAISNRRVSDATSLAASQAPRSPSTRSFGGRHRSNSSVSLAPGDGFVNYSDQNNNGSGATTPRFSSFSINRNQSPQSRGHTRAGSSPEIIDEADLGDVGMMPPPDYEDVSLDDADDDHSRRGRSGATTPVMIFNSEAPPTYDYTETARSERRRLSSSRNNSHEDRPEERDLSTAASDGNSHHAPSTNRDEENDDGRSSRTSKRSSRGVGGVPQLPSLRIGSLPQIVVEPSSAHPDRQR